MPNWVSGGGIFQGNPSAGIGTGNTFWYAFRDSYGAYWLRKYHPTAGFGAPVALGGVLASDPAMAVTPDGVVYLVGRDLWNGVWACRYEPQTNGTTWVFLGGLIKGMPAVTAGHDRNIYLAVRDMTDNLWTGRLEDLLWQGWHPTGGVSIDDPRLSVNNSLILLVIRDYGSSVWSCAYSAHADYCTAWLNTGGLLAEVDVVGADADFHLVGRDAAGSTWWYRFTTQHLLSVEYDCKYIL